MMGEPVMPDRRMILFGAGGHAKVVYDAILTAMPGVSIEVFDGDPARTGAAFFRSTILFAPVGGVIPAGLVHIAIGDNRVRRKIGAAIAAQGRNLMTVVHPAGVVSPGAKMGNGVFVAAAAIVSAAAVVNDGTIVNHGAVIDHDCVIGSWSHIAPNATLGGGVTIEEECLIGAGAVVLPGLSVGFGAVVGAGAVVTRNVSPGSTVMGVPAREIYVECET